MTLSEIVRVSRGSFGFPAEMEISEISADTRTIKTVAVFISRKGERYDVADFSKEAI